RLAISDALLQPPKLDRSVLAGLYRRAAVVLVTSEAEGFGFPVLEALACGAVVVASDLPTLREVGGNAVLYAPMGDVSAWTAMVSAALDQPNSAPSRETRLARARTFTWEQHAQRLRDAYADLAKRSA